MSSQARAPTNWDLRTQLNRDFQRLYQLCVQVLAALREGDREQAAASWAQFDTGLRNHLDFEELHLYPRFRKLYPKAAVQLLAEHAQVLSLLNQLKPGVELPRARADMIDELCSWLRAHAEREDTQLYRWAQAHASELEPYAPQPTPGARQRRRP